MDSEKNDKSVKVVLLTQRFLKSAIINSKDIDFKEFVDHAKQQEEQERPGKTDSYLDLEAENKVKENEIVYLKNSNLEQSKQLAEAKDIIENLIK